MSSFNGSLIFLSTNLSQIGASAFSFCSNFQGNLILPDSLSVLNSSVFASSSFPGSLTLPYQLTQIKNYTFSHCQFLSGHVVLPQFLLQIGDSAFQFCSSISDFVFNSSLFPHIGNAAFQNCSGISILNISCSIIEAHAFLGCSNLTSLVVSADSIEEQSFAFCSKLTKITFLNAFKYKPSSFNGSPVLSVEYFASDEVPGEKPFPSEPKLVFHKHYAFETFMGYIVAKNIVQPLFWPIILISVVILCLAGALFYFIKSQDPDNFSYSPILLIFFGILLLIAAILYFVHELVHENLPVWAIIVIEIVILILMVIVIFFVKQSVFHQHVAKREKLETSIINDFG
jgi:uncharacterized membrane protein